MIAPFSFCRQSSSGKPAGMFRLVSSVSVVAVAAGFPSSRGQEGADFPMPVDLPRQVALPDPLVMRDGRKVTTREMWRKERRPELLRLFQHYMVGQLPAKPKAVSSKVERVDAAAFGGKATLSEVTLTFGVPEAPPIHLLLVVPNQRKTKAPVVLGMNYFGNHTLVHDKRVRLADNWMPERGAGVVGNRATEASRGTWADIWRTEDVIDRGYALATFYNGDIDPDTSDQRGLQKFFRQPDPAEDCGTIGAWAWGLQRAVDYLVTAPGIDPRRIVVTGHSRLGKAALLAAAFDERIAMAIPHQAGCGGSAPSRARIAMGKPYNTLDTPQTKPPETVADINGKFPHWFNARFKEFNTQPERLPFDQNCLVALCAPRPVLFTNGRADTWINPAGQFEVLRAAAPVYRLLGAGDFKFEELPPDGELMGGTLGYYLRPGAHSLLREDWKVFLDFADAHLGRPASKKSSAEKPASDEKSNEKTAATVQVPRWEIYEFALQGRCTAANPFTDCALKGEFTSPSGKAIHAEGFYDGGSTWRLRFAPNELGDWTYVLRGEGVEILQRGKLRCTKARGHGGRGFIGIHPKNPYAFAYADGSPFFPMGDTCYGLFDDSPITPELRAEYLKTRRAQRFNFVRMTVGHSEARAASDSTYWAWGGTPQKPDLDRLNPAFFRAFDDLIRQLRASGMNVELIVLNFYRRPFTDTILWTPACERLWLRYLIARYGAFDNIFLWTIANEYETHPDGKYRLDYPADVDWAKATARFIKANDPYGHLVTVHPVISASRRGESPRSPFDLPWRIGEFFGADEAMDVLSQQTGNLGDGLIWDKTLKCWTGDPTNLVASLNADRRFKKPVLNTENGYEYLRGDSTMKEQVHHTDKVRRSAWRIMCAGGYFAAGFHGTIGHSDVWNRLDAPNHYTFLLKSEGAAAQLATLHDFFSKLPFWRMQPFTGVSGDAVALAEPGKIYVVYLSHGGAITMDFAATEEPLIGRWFNPRDGKFGKEFRTRGIAAQQFTAPDAEDWVLLVKTAANNLK
jgi:hypothetical protein